MAATDLKFDKQKVCIKLAEEYLTKKEFHSIGYSDDEKYECNKFGNKIYFVESIAFVDVLKTYKYGKTQYTGTADTYSKKIFDLAQKIEENTDLFCQLEYLLRNIPVNETKNIDLKLITQTLLYHNSYLNPEHTPNGYLCLNSTTPLFYLGFFARNRIDDIHLSIVCTKDTAAVCTLFVELCRDVGLTNEVKLGIVNKDFILAPELEMFTRPLDSKWRGGCVGVVADRSDVDSAVDTFLCASVRYPWKLRKIFVQESALERFKCAIEWKTKLNAYESHVPESILQSCTATYRYEGKVFLYEFVGDHRSIVSSPLNVTEVETYRTVKELMSLLEASGPFAVSLWSSDVAESNEIAFGLQTDIVWINTHERFHGTPISSEALYYRKDPMTNEAKEFKATLQLKEAWVKLPLQTRLNRVREALRIHQKRLTEQVAVELALDSNTDTTIDSHVCIAVRKPVEITRVDVKYVHISNRGLFRYLVEGGVAIIVGDITEGHNSLIDLLSEAGAPVAVSLGSAPDKQRSQMYKIKAIWSSVGTIFAN